MFSQLLRVHSHYSTYIFPSLYVTSSSCGDLDYADNAPTLVGMENNCQYQLKFTKELLYMAGQVGDGVPHTNSKEKLVWSKYGLPFKICIIKPRMVLVLI